MSSPEIKQLLGRFLKNELNSDELFRFRELVLSGENDKIIVDAIELALKHDESKYDSSLNEDVVFERVTSIGQYHKAAHRVHFLKTAWFRYAAAVLIVICCTYLITIQKSKPVPVKIVTTEDIPAPLNNRATLTLANGQKFFLDAVENGTLAVEGGTSIEKNAEGLLVYNINSKSKIIQYNELSVPKGSQVAALILSDGSKVFLNAGSTLKYPVAFNNIERKVEISGEAYFQITKDAKRKFVVVSGGIATEVLGTSFNVNNYSDELSTKITLVEGRVKVSLNKSELIIKPGQQVEAENNKTLKLNKTADISEVTAWQKGRFIFTKMDLYSILRQVSRWYNVRIEYRGKIPERTYSGGLSRKSPLSEVVGILTSNGVNCIIEDSVLIIENN